MNKIEKNYQTDADFVMAMARQKGIHAEKIFSLNSVYKLKGKGKSYIVNKSVPSLTNAVSYRICERKDWTFKVLKELKFPVPETKTISSFEEGRIFLKKYKTIVIKPIALTWGLGVTAGIESESELKSAIKNVLNYLPRHENKFLVQEFAKGDDYRILVVGYEDIFCFKREQPYLIGDGKLSIANLIAKGKIITISNRNFQKIPRDLIRVVLKKQGFSFNSIVPKGTRVTLGNIANTHMGGVTIDCTDNLSKEVIKIMITLAKKLKLPIVGIDWITQDLSSKEGKIIEINSAPDLTVHFKPVFGKSRNPAESLINFLFFTKSNDRMVCKENFD